MSLLKYFMFLAIVALTDGSNILPRAPHPDIRSPAFFELHDVILKARSDIKPRGIHDRLHIPAHTVRKRMQSQESAAAAVKRTLLGARQSCDAGYGYCYASGRCCPNSDGTGKCCDDGTCVTSSQTCCLYGGACDTGLDCCLNGCKPQENTCCSGDTNCDPGSFCCNNGSCAPEGGECCEDGSVCDTGLHCVIFDGQQKCCEDLSCGGGGSATNDYTYSVPDVSITTYSLPSVTLPSFTTPTFSFSSYPFSSISLPSFTESITIPTVTPSPGVIFRYYYTTWTWYYYYYYLTLVTSTTSTYITTTTIVSVYATASSDAQSSFASLSAETTFPSATTAPGITRAPSPVATPAASTSSTSSTTATRPAQVSAFPASAAHSERQQMGWTLVAGIVAAVASGLFIIWV